MLDLSVVEGGESLRLDSTRQAPFAAGLIVRAPSRSEAVRCRNLGCAKYHSKMESICGRIHTNHHKEPSHELVWTPSSALRFDRRDSAVETSGNGTATGSLCQSFRPWIQKRALPGNCPWNRSRPLFTSPALHSSVGGWSICMRRGGLSIFWRRRI